MVRLTGEVDGIIGEIYNKKNDAEYARLIEYSGAVKIQAWFRATRTRTYFKHINKCATVIQKRWRGFLGRRFYRILLKNTLFIMKLNNYNTMACKVQKVWRGYYVRKYVFNYYSRKRYLEALQVKNEIIRSELAEYSEQQDAARKREEEKQEMHRRKMEARRQHYLVSTEVQPGIYNSPFLPYPSEKEYLLRNVRPLSHKKLKKEGHEFDPAWVKYNGQVPKTLPPLVQRPQGPFREPADVQKQRYKSFQPSLRVSTDFCSLEQARRLLKDEEWVTRLNDATFIPFTHHSVPYEKLLHSTSCYGHLPYGTKYYREEFMDRHVVATNFKTLVPPIPVFGKLNDTYSQGQV